MELDSFERDLMQWNDASSVREEERERYRPLVEAAKVLLAREPITDQDEYSAGHCFYCGAPSGLLTGGGGARTIPRHKDGCLWVCLCDATPQD